MSGFIAQQLGRPTCNQAVMGSIPGRAAIKLPRSTHSAFHSSGVGKSSTSLAGWD